VLNLFLALLLSSFSSDQLQGADSDDADVNKIQEAINRIARFISFIKGFIRRKICFCCKRKKEKKPLGDTNATSKTSVGGNSLLKAANDGGAISIFIDGKKK
jgi:Sodium ion transport-associated